MQADSIQGHSKRDVGNDLWTVVQIKPNDMLDIGVMGIMGTSRCDVR